MNSEKDRKQEIINWSVRKILQKEVKFGPEHFS